jgi:hypothetical protein
LRVIRRRCERNAAAAALAAGIRTATTGSASTLLSNGAKGSESADVASDVFSGGSASPACSALPERAKAIFTITRKPAAGIAAAIHPMGDCSESTTCSLRDSTTATPITVEGKTSD